MGNSEIPDNGVLTLDRLNRQEVLRQIPLLVYLSGIAVFGIIGNICVCFVYKTKYGPSNCRTFVIFLSAVDLFSCSLVIPFEILVILRQYKFHNGSICKLSVFLNTWPTLTSGLMLLAIAVDRYRKVCKPFLWQISLTKARNICFVNMIIAVAFSWLSPVIYGIYTSNHHEHNITTSECAVTKEMKESVYPLVNNISFGILFLGTLTSISIMYCFIGVEVKAHAKTKRPMTFKSRRSEIISLADTSIASEFTINSGQIVVNKAHSKSKRNKDPDSESDAIFLSETSDSKGVCADSLELEPCLPTVGNIERGSRDKNASSGKSVNRKSVIERVLSFGRHSVNTVSKSLSSASKSSGTSSVTILPSTRANKMDSKQIKARRTAFIMFLVSLAFICSYLPLLCILLIRSSISGYVDSLSDDGRTTYKFFLRSYYLNCAVNPVIYGLWDARFRKTVKKLFCKRTSYNISVK